MILQAIGDFSAIRFDRSLFRTIDANANRFVVGQCPAQYPL